MIELLIADAGPLIALSKIRKVDLLCKLARRVFVPQKVWLEVFAKGRDAPDAAYLESVSGIMVYASHVREKLRFQLMLDAGEEEVLLIALNNPNSFVLLDDAKARRIAKSLEMRIIGTLGILRRAKKNGFIPEVRPLIEALKSNGIYIGRELETAILRDVGEIK
jgi:hypothetical protein